MQILDHEIENGRLHYNIANAYLLAGDIPEAILHFRRAERFLSGHANLATNLAIARSRVETKFEYSQANEFVRVALFWHYDLSPAIRFQLMIWSFVACWIWLLVRIQARFSNQPAWPAALALIFALCMFSSLWYESRIEWAADEAVVMIEATGRTGPSQIGYAPSLSQPLAPGVEVVILEQRADWALVRLADGRTTWLPGVALEPI